MAGPPGLDWRRDCRRSDRGRRSGGFEGVGGAVVVDARRPDRGLALGEVALRRQARIGVAPALDVHEVLGAREDRAAADALARLRCRQLALQTCGQLAQDAGRDAVALGRIDEAEQYQVGHEHAPVITEARDQPRPVDALGGGSQDMRDVAAVEALALHDEGLRPDHLLGGDEPHGPAEHLFPDAVTEPLVVDGGHAVAGAEDDVDEVVAAPRLAEPVRKRQLRLAPRRGQRRQHALDVARVHEDVEVLRVARDPRVALEGVGATDEELEAGLVQQAHRAQVEVASGGRQLGVGHGMVAPMPVPAWTGGGADGGPPLVRSTWTSMTRNGGSFGKRRRRSGSATLYTGTPELVRPSGEPRCAWPWKAAVTG